MSKSYRKQAILWVLILFSNIFSVTIVYNLRIAETTKRQIRIAAFKKYTIGAAILIDQIRKRRDFHEQNIFAGLGTILKVLNPFYFRADFAVGRVRDTLFQQKFSRTQTDDVILYAGYGHDLGEKTKVTISTLVGIPTHDDSAFQGLQLGTGHLGVGGQADIAIRYTGDDKHILLGAFRYVRFFPAMVNINVLNIARRFAFNIGNLTDILIGHATRFGMNALEFGYTASFAYGASLEPALPITADIDFIRNSFYLNYRHVFFIQQKIPSAFGLGVSWGFDSKPKTLGFKSIFTIWGLWGIAF